MLNNHTRPPPSLFIPGTCFASVFPSTSTATYRTPFSSYDRSTTRQQLQVTPSKPSRVISICIALCDNELTVPAPARATRSPPATSTTGPCRSSRPAAGSGPPHCCSPSPQPAVPSPCSQQTTADPCRAVTVITGLQVLQAGTMWLATRSDCAISLLRDRGKGKGRGGGGSLDSPGRGGAGQRRGRVRGGTAWCRTGGGGSTPTGSGRTGRRGTSAKPTLEHQQSKVL